MVLQRLLQQLQRLGRAVAAAHAVYILLRAVQQRAGEGRRAHAHVAGGDDGLQPSAPDIHLHGVILQNVAVDVAQADGTLAAGLQNHGGQALALSLEVGHHGAAGDPAHQPIALIDLHARPHDAAIQQRDGGDLPGQAGHVGKVTIHVLHKVSVLLLQRGAADVIALLFREADGELGQRHGENGDLAAVGGGTHLVAVQRHARLHAQGVPRTQTGRPARPSPPAGSTATPRLRCGHTPRSPAARRYSRSWPPGPRAPPATQDPARSSWARSSARRR